MGPAVKIEGLSELSRALRRVSSDYGDEQREIHRRIAEPIAADARSRVRSRSGRLAASIRPLAGKRYARVAAGRNSSTLPYGAINHWGGYPGEYEGNEFLLDALDARREIVADDYTRETDAFLDRVWATTKH